MPREYSLEHTRNIGITLLALDEAIHVSRVHGGAELVQKNQLIGYVFLMVIR